MIETSPLLKAMRFEGLVAHGDGRYADRAVAGRQLAEQLRAYHGELALVLALPPGGVVVAGELACALRLPLDALIARVFAAPLDPTHLLGAISEGGGLCFNRTALRLPGASLASAWRAARHARRELIALVAAYRGTRRLPLLKRRSIILVDDGLGSGLAQLAALQALRRAHGHRLIVATPWATDAAAQRVLWRADALIALTRVEDQPGRRAPCWSAPLDDDPAAMLLKRYRHQVEIG